MSRTLVFWSTIAFLSAGCGAATGLLGDGESDLTHGGAAGDDPGVDPSGGASRGGTGSGGLHLAAGGKSAVGAAGGSTAFGGASAAAGGSPSKPISAEELNQATSVCAATPWIFTSTVPNSRSLGGVPLANGSVSCGRLYRGSQLVTLGVEGCAEFVRLGIRSVIDLRTASEAATRSPKCTFDQAGYLAAPMPTPYNLSPADYIADLHATDSMLAIFRVLGDVTAYPVYFHCVYGRDRTAVLAALILRLLGASREVVMAEYMRTEDSGFGVAPASLGATLDELDRLGGAEAYLLSIGVPAQAIDVVRTQLTAPAASTN